MKNRIILSLLAALLLLAAATPRALAWPDQPPEKVLISGPGLEGQVEVTDPHALAIFQLGTLEDFDSSAPPPSTGAEYKIGYTIVRFFEGGTFDFARLTYYPKSIGPGYLHFQDGPMLVGDHTPYNDRWLLARPEAENKLRDLLKRLGAARQENSANGPVALMPIAVVSPFADLAWPALVIAGLVGVLLALRLLRKESRTNRTSG